MSGADLACLCEEIAGDLHCAGNALRVVATDMDRCRESLRDMATELRSRGDA